MNTATVHSRPRRLLSLLAALAMMASLAVVNASPAFASADGHARLTSGVTVLPGSAQYGIAVTTGDDPVTDVVIGVPQGIGITIPSDQNLDQDGFEGEVVDIADGRQRIEFTGGEIPADSSVTFGFAADIAAPTTAEQDSGKFFVSLSGDDGETFAQAQEGDGDLLDNSGTLRTTIKFLEIIELRPGGSFTGLLDGTGTEGQSFRMWANVKNYALASLSVTTSLNASSNGDDGFTSDESISGPESQTITAGGTEWYAFDVTLGTALQDGEPADRPVTFTASPVADVSGATGIPNSMGFTVEVLSQLNLDGPSFEPRLVAPGTSKAFNVDASASGTPDFTINAASISFGDTVADLGSNPTFSPGGDASTLTYTGDVAAEDGEYPVSYSYTATDDNGFTYSFEDVALTEPDGGVLGTGLDSGDQPVTVTIDGLGPILDAVIDLPDDADGRAQTAAKDGDEITVSGNIDDEVSDAWVTEVTLSTAGGDEVATATGDAINDNGSDDGSWSVTFSGDDVDFGASTGQFNAEVTGVDEAGNANTVGSDFADFDNIVPFLDVALVESTTDLDLDGATSLLTGGQPAVITARFDENGVIKGGCDPRQWEIDGQNIVREVRYSDGELCSPGQEGPDNDRVLVLSVPIERWATPLVRYTPVEGDRVGDRAGNLALEDTVTAINNILPAIPDLLDVYRNTTADPEACQVEDGEESPCEDAYQDSGADGTGDTDSYWTRFDGNDTVVCLAGARSGYEVEVVDSDGNVLSTVDAPDTTPCVRVDIGSEEGVVTRGLRYVNDAGAGEALEVDFGLDSIAPDWETVSQNGDELTVQFDDFLIAGSNAALNWNVQQRSQDGSTTDNPPASVDTPCEGVLTSTCDTSQRVIDANLEDPDGFLGLSYLHSMSDRYEDRGGNTLADFLDAS